MSTKDYTFAAGCFGTIYLTKKTKPRKNGLHLMSEDRRVLDESEIFYIFEHYLRQFCQEHDTDTLNVTGKDGKVIFQAILKDNKKGGEP